MTVDLPSLLAALVPDLYCERFLERDGRRVRLRHEVKRVFQKEGLLAAAQIARLRESSPLDLDHADVQNPFSRKLLSNPIEQHLFERDAFGESAVGFYFRLLDLLSSDTQCQVEKLVDSFVAAPGSRHGADLGNQLARAQDRMARLLEEARRLIEGIEDRLVRLRMLKQRLAASSSETVTREADRLRSELQHLLRTARLKARWLQPYLRTVPQLTPLNAARNPEMLSLFNTALIEVTLLVRWPEAMTTTVAEGTLPKFLLKPSVRRAEPVVLVSFSFRGVPEHSRSGGYVFRGRVRVLLTSCALNSVELKALRDALEQEALGDLYRAVGSSDESRLDQFEEEINELLDESPPEPSKGSDDINPISALFSFLWNRPREPRDEGLGGDSDYEKVLRNHALWLARRNCRGYFRGLKSVSND